MHLTIRAFVLGSIMVVSLGCSSSSDAAAKAQPELAPAQAPQLEQKAPVQHAEPSQAAPLKAADPASAAAPAVAANALCLTVCRKASGLRCASAEDCSKGCEELLSPPGCQTVMVSFLECLSKEPLEHWECDGNVPGLKDGYCEKEQDAVGRCIGSAS